MPEEHHVSNFKGLRDPPFVVVLGHALVALKQILTDVGPHLPDTKFSIGQQFIDFPLCRSGEPARTGSITSNGIVPGGFLLGVVKIQLQVQRPFIPGGLGGTVIGNQCGAQIAGKTLCMGRLWIVRCSGDMLDA